MVLFGPKGNRLVALSGQPLEESMSRSSLPGRPSRWRRAGAALAVATLPFTMAACADDEPVDDPGVVEEEPLEEEEDD